MQFNLNTSIYSNQTLIQCIKSSLEKICTNANKKAAATAQRKETKQNAKSTKK